MQVQQSHSIHNMTLPGVGSSISFSQIEAEFGSNVGQRLGNYRRDENPDFKNASPINSDLNLPLDTGIPTSGEIKFSQFRGKKLNMIIDYYNGDPVDDPETDLTKEQAADIQTMAATWRYLNKDNRVKVVGGFRGKPIGSVNAGSNYTLSSGDWQGGKKIIVHVNQTVGGKKDGDVTDVALRTGVWPTGTTLQVDVGSSGRLQGAGGDGGDGSPGTASANGGDGDDGTSALGIEYPATINNSGVIRCGYGGGGGGSGAANNPDDKSTTDFGRSGAGGGGGAGLPAGAGGAEGTGGFNGSEPLDGSAGGSGNLNGGGQGGIAGAEGGATGGDGGDGGDFEAPAEDGDTGIQGRAGAGYDPPGTKGNKGSDGKAIYFRSSSIANDSTITGNTVDGRNGGTANGSFN